MGLTDRLADARSAHRAGNDHLPDPPPLHLADAPPLIDLRDEAIVEQLSQAPSYCPVLAVSGSGEACPNCGGPTRLDMIDTVGGVDHYACRECNLLFQTLHVPDDMPVGP